MRNAKNKIAVLSANSSSLLAYAGALNTLGYYSISLSDRATEVIGLLSAGKRFNFLIYDGFELNTDANSLQAIANYRAVDSIITIADVNSHQRQHLMSWAKKHDIPLAGVLQSPLRPPELQLLLEMHEHPQKPKVSCSNDSRSTVPDITNGRIASATGCNCRVT